MKNLDNHIKNKTFSNLYVIFGEENYLKNKYEKQLIQTILDENFKMMNFDMFEGKNINVTNVIDACNTLPFMNEHRLVILKNTDLLYDAKKDDTKTLEQYFENIPKTTILVFIEQKIDKKLKIYKTANKLGSIHQIDTLSEQDLINWITSFLNQNKKTITPKECLYIIRNVGYNMEILQNELNKLISLKKDEKITTEDIDCICTKSIESNIFDLINFMANKNVEKALDIYKTLIFNKTSPFLILNMIYRQFKIILQTKYLYNKGYNLNNISTELKLRDFIVREAFNQSKNFNIKTLVNGLNECLETDNNIKTGKINDELGVELLIIKYTSL